ncbi:MAG: helix-turn-helix domain-containing protein [Pseudolabrys sp.]|nr:helix-turn-helix domain-containing protein [Pseudolabrys sp.]MDP2297534.1 helix-turn-helix domain-containing protein [Pseudolabrys sp.]
MSADSRGKAQANAETGRATPGAHLRAELRRLGLDQVAVSKATGVSRQSVNNIINGRQPISRAMAGKLGRLTGHGSDYWLSEWFDESGVAPSARGAPAPAGSGLLVDHQIARAIRDGIIGITPFLPENLRAISIDLTLSDVVTLSGGGQVNIARPKGYILAPGAAVSATTKESIELPRDYYGRVGATGALCRHGIIAATDFQIEPGFKGLIQFHLFNAGGGPVRLRASDRALGLEISRLTATPDNNPLSQRPPVVSKKL